MVESLYPHPPDLPFDPVITPPGVYPTGISAHVQNDMYTKVLFITVFVTSKDWKYSKSPLIKDQ